MGQLSALFYKNWVLYKRGLLGNVLQLLVPIFFVFFIVLVRKIDEPTPYATQSFYTNPLYSFTISGSSPTNAFLKNCSLGSIVGIAPTGDPLVTSLSASLTGLGYTPQSFVSQTAFENYVRDPNYPNTPKICFGIVVDSSSGTYQYKLRFNTTIDQTKTEAPVTTFKVTEDQAIDLNIYNRSMRGMIGAGTLVNNAIFKKEVSSTKNIKHSIAPIYQEEYVLDNIYENLGTTIGIIVLLPLLLIYLRQTSSMLSEKQSKVRESMSIMGMKMSNYYFSWFIRYLAVYAVLHLICSAIIARQLKHVPFYIPFIIFILFDVLLIIQNFFIQVFLSRAKIGVVISLLFFIVQYILSFISTNSDNPTIGVNAAISIIPHAAFIIAFQTMVYAQSAQITPTFGMTLNNYVIGYALASFILNIVFYLLLTWYLDQVVPNEWGAKNIHSSAALINRSPHTLKKKKREKKDRKRKQKDMQALTSQSIKILKCQNKITNTQTLLDSERSLMEDNQLQSKT